MSSAVDDSPCRFCIFPYWRLFVTLAMKAVPPQSVN
jgi:hypothetical protein